MRPETASPAARMLRAAFTSALAMCPHTVTDPARHEVDVILAMPSLTLPQLSLPRALW